jgi:hypothetical protein
VSVIAATAGGGTTTGEIVLSAICLSESSTTYLIGVAIPTKFATGVKVTRPVVEFTE